MTWLGGWRKWMSMRLIGFMFEFQVMTTWLCSQMLFGGNVGRCSATSQGQHGSDRVFPSLVEHVQSVMGPVMHVQSVMDPVMHLQSVMRPVMRLQSVMSLVSVAGALKTLDFGALSDDPWGVIAKCIR